MRFDKQQTFSYERSFFVTGSMLELIRPDDGTNERFALSGLHDYREGLLITHEWYELNFPRLTIKELKAPTETDIDPLYNEPRSRHKEFDRLLDIPAKIEQEKVNLKRQKEGPQRIQGVKLWMGLWHLMNADYWPRVGDEFTFRNVLHEITLVHIDPADYWQASGWPLHVSIDAKQVQFGDHLPNTQPHERKRDTGAGVYGVEGIPSGQDGPASDSKPGNTAQDVKEPAQVGGNAGSDGANTGPGTPYIDLPPPADEYC